eukprot:714168_1
MVSFESKVGKRRRLTSEAPRFADIYNFESDDLDNIWRKSQQSGDFYSISQTGRDMYDFALRDSVLMANMQLKLNMSPVSEIFIWRPTFARWLQYMSVWTRELSSEVARMNCAT